MSISKVTLSAEPLKYKRLLAVDITRIPNPQEHKQDIYYDTSTEQIKRLKRKAFLQKIFTVATFGIAGLYMAHKNDCFKPIKKEVKNLLKDTGVQNRVKQFVQDANPLEHYSDYISKYLSNLSKSDKANQALRDEAANVLSAPERLKHLILSIVRKAKGEKIDTNQTISPQEYNDGIFYTLMEKLKIRLEKDLYANKKNGIPYKNKGAEVFENLFKQNGDSTPMDDLLYDVVRGRISEGIDKYLDNAIINAG